MRNLQGVISFVESVEGGSFTAAAARLDLTPAAVSKNVMRLEKELQVRLFNRSTRKLALTSEGEAFLAKAREAIGLLDDAVAEASRSSQEVSGRVRITSGLAFGRRFVLPILSRLALRHPKLELELSPDNKPVDLTSEGFDLALRGGVSFDANIVARHICPIYSVLVASRGYLDRHGIPTRPAQLREHRVLGIRFTTGETMPWGFLGKRGEPAESWMPHAQIWCSDPDSLIELALAGEGIAQAGLLHAAPHLRRGELFIVLHGRYDNGKREMSLCYTQRKYQTRRVQTVIDALLEGFAQDEDLRLRLEHVPRAWCA